MFISIPEPLKVARNKKFINQYHIKTLFSLVRVMNILHLSSGAILKIFCVPLNSEKMQVVDIYT